MAAGPTGDANEGMRSARYWRDRAEEADRRVREGVALVAMSRDVAMATTFDEAAAEIALRLQADAEMDEVWVEAQDRPGVAVAQIEALVPRGAAEVRPPRGEEHVPAVRRHSSGRAARA